MLTLYITAALLSLLVAGFFSMAIWFFLASKPGAGVRWERKAD